MPPLVIAHRGASAEAPENTLRAFARALELGVDGIELDVQVTRDGIPVVFHDFTLTRLTGTRGRLADRTWAELRNLRVGACPDKVGPTGRIARTREFTRCGDEPIPTLADALALTCKRAMVQIEIKKGVPVAPVLAAIRRTASSRNVILASFEPDILREAATLAPKLTRMLIVDSASRYSKREDAKGSRVGTSVIGLSSVALAKEDHPSLVMGHSPLAMHLVQAMVSARASGLSVEHRAATSPLFVETIHRHGAQLWCWTVNNAPEMRRLRAYAVDAILTDDPAKLIKALCA
jgi:glycerophosphoryl diester phosphodiesterase